MINRIEVKNMQAKMAYRDLSFGSMFHYPGVEANVYMVVLTGEGNASVSLRTGILRYPSIDQLVSPIAEDVVVTIIAGGNNDHRTML
jgi:hypothetical protein